MKHKNPILAAILNVILPGLGCAYVGRWFYAVVFFIWIPLVYTASLVVVTFISSFIHDVTLKNISTVFIALLLFVRILYEQISVPYNMAVDFNQRIETNND